ncbi:hypothetical protein BC834DRAFT_538175 [Gloeopeniophorella convolvens]|nr:hypothetical protein BC834DRAFT_538175 [Gloeopeniophorella convolvens]
MEHLTTIWCPAPCVLQRLNWRVPLAPSYPLLHFCERFLLDVRNLLPFSGTVLDPIGLENPFDVWTRGVHGAKVRTRAFTVVFRPVTFQIIISAPGPRAEQARDVVRKVRLADMSVAFRSASERALARGASRKSMSGRRISYRGQFGGASRCDSVVRWWRDVRCDGL